MATYAPAEPVTSLDQVRAIIPKEFSSQTGKIIDHIDDYVRVWIERSPFVTIGTHDRQGRADVAPKGDPAGFVKVLDKHTLAIPDRPGNHRWDTFQNILETGRIALMFLMPNRNEVVRVNGRAEIARDADLRQRMAVNDRVPEFAIVVHVAKVVHGPWHCDRRRGQEIRLLLSSSLRALEVFVHQSVSSCFVIFDYSRASAQVRQHPA